MAVFLSVLRIIGIVLLCILAAILLMILLVLFVPFRYRVDGSKEDKLHARARVHWLLYFVIVDLLYDDGINMRLRILGIPLYDKKKKEAKAEKKRLKAEAKAEKKRKKEEALAAKKAGKDGAAETAAAAEGAQEATEAGSAVTMGSETAALEAEKKDEDGGEEKAADKDTDDAGTKEKKRRRFGFKRKEKKARGKAGAEEDTEGEGKEKKPSIGERISAAWDAFTDLLWELPDKADEGIDGLLEKAEALGNKVSELWDTVDYYQRLLGSDGTAWVIEYVKKRVFKILKGIRPRKIKAYAEIRDEDPGKVAKIWQYYAISLPILDHIPGKVEVDAQQDEKSFKFKAMVKGRVFVITLVKNGLALLLNRKVKRFIKLLKRETEQGKE